MDLQRKVGHSTDNGKQCQARAESGSQLLQGDALGKSSSEAKICSATESGSLDPLVLGEHPEPTTGLSESKDQQIKVELRCLNDESLTLVGLKSDFNKNLFFRGVLSEEREISVNFDHRFVAGTFTACPIGHGFIVLNEPKIQFFSFEVADHFKLMPLSAVFNLSVERMLKFHLRLGIHIEVPKIAETLSIADLFKLCFTSVEFNETILCSVRPEHPQFKIYKDCIEISTKIFLWRLLYLCSTSKHVDMVMSGFLRLLKSFPDKRTDFSFLPWDEKECRFVDLGKTIRERKISISRKRFGVVFLLKFIEMYRSARNDVCKRENEEPTSYPEGWFE